MYPLVRAQAAQIVYAVLVDETDLNTPETGIVSPTITISKNGGAFASPSDGTWTELGSGIYTVRLDATDTATAGPLAVLISASGCAPFRALCYVRDNAEVSAALNSIDGKSAADVLQILLSMAQGKFTKSGDAVTFYAQDNTTDLFTLTLSSTERTRS